MERDERLSPLKVIFLDIDGVLNTTRAHIAFKTNQWDPVAVGMLDRVCRETGAKLVISSVWRFSMQSWVHTHQVLDAVGLGHHMMLASHVGEESIFWLPDQVESEREFDHHRTPGGHDNPRGERIQAWIDHFKPDVYAIIDDDSDMLEHQMPYFVKTNCHDGIVFETYQRLLEILGELNDNVAS